MPGWPLANQGGCAHKTSTSHDRQREGHCFMASPSHTKEPQYSLLFDVREKHGITRLGLMVNESWNQDPKRTLFTLARYKFVAKMLAGRERVLEVGCADAFGTRIVQQATAKVTAVDFDPIFIADVKERMNPHWPIEAFVHDLLAGPVAGAFDAAYALDVLEHIEEKDEDRFIGNVVASLAPTGVAIFGMPSLESQGHASPQSKAGHVNCKSGDALKRTLECHFHTVFVFSMNDEVVHTGFYPMAHYLLGVACHRRSV
jgi:2-polyprenyl-3-methyl-5-hydroxy-6-metoxy-1,4-benzoquinol methylase